MLKRWINKTKKRLLLGQVVILERKDFRAQHDVDDNFRKQGESDAWIRQMVLSVVDLQKVESENSNHRKAVGVDIIIAHHQLGDIATLRVEDVSLPILWRPQLHVVFRVFNVKCGSTIESFEYKKKMSWLVYFRRLLAFRLVVPFGIRDIEPLFIAVYVDFLKAAKNQGFV